MRRRHSHLRAFAALLAAYGLVLQALLLGLMLGVSAAAASSSSPGWLVLCTPSGTTPTPEGGGPKTGAPTCCVAGACGLAFGLPGGTATPLDIPLRFAQAAVLPPARAIMAPQRRGHLPQARAPPAPTRG